MNRSAGPPALKEQCPDKSSSLETLSGAAIFLSSLTKNNTENLVESSQTPIKQKKEDPKFDEIKSVLGKEIVESLFSPKWEVKKHGFELINEFINSKDKALKCNKIASQFKTDHLIESRRFRILSPFSSSS